MKIHITVKELKLNIIQLNKETLVVVVVVAVVQSTIQQKAEIIENLNGKKIEIIWTLLYQQKNQRHHIMSR